MTDPVYPVRMRLWIAGKLVSDDIVVMDESWTEDQAAEAGEEVMQRHVGMVERAEREGKKWMAEMLDVNTGNHKRFGTDPMGMVDPQPYEGQGLWP